MYEDLINSLNWLMRNLFQIAEELKPLALETYEHINQHFKWLLDQKAQFKQTVEEL